jgi:preprotein translocase subunit SecF
MDLLTINEQQAEIEELKATAASNEERFHQNDYAATHISFLGIDFTKSLFKIIMSSLVLVLLALVAAGYTRFSYNSSLAETSSRECKKVEAELEDLRKKSLEKQIKLARELQTQKNMVEELRNQGTITKKISA